MDAPATASTLVSVSCAVERAVTDYAYFTALTAAVDSVEVRAHDLSNGTGRNSCFTSQFPA